MKQTLVKKMTIEEVREKTDSIVTMLDMAAEHLTAEQFEEVKLTDEEVKAFIVGAMSALNAVGNLYLGGMDGTNPQAVTNARSMDAASFSAMIINAAAGTYHKFFVAEDGDEQ